MLESYAYYLLESYVGKLCLLSVRKLCLLSVRKGKNLCWNVRSGRLATGSRRRNKFWNARRKAGQHINVAGEASDFEHIISGEI